jgi:hypothetical protein
MTQVDPESSLERLFGLLECHNSNLLDLLRAKTAHEFIAVMEGAIERAMKTIENGSKEYSKLPDKPRSSKQQYRITEAGRTALVTARRR